MQWSQNRGVIATLTKTNVTNKLRVDLMLMQTKHFYYLYWLFKYQLPQPQDGGCFKVDSCVEGKTLTNGTNACYRMNEDLV